MAFRYHPLLWQGIPACIRLLAEHPLLASRFGTTANLVESAVASARTLDSVMPKALEERLLDGLTRLLGDSRLRERRLPGLP